MFMRYFGGGIRHLTQLSQITDSNAMDVDHVPAHGDDGNVMTEDDVQIHHLEQLAQQAVHDHVEPMEESDNAEESDDSEEEDRSGCDETDSDVDLENLDDHYDSDLGPEDGEGDLSDDEYGSL
jgi:hypothetical protein